MIKRPHLYNRIWKSIINSTYAEYDTIQLFRQLFVLIYLVFLFENNLWLAEIPDALYQPPRLSLGVFLWGFPGFGVIMLLHLINVISLAFIALDKKKAVMGIMFIITTIIIQNLRYSFGKIDHAILIPAVIFCFTLTNWNSNNRRTWLIPIPGQSLLALLLVFGMFTAGIQKSLNWIDFDFSKSGFLSWYYIGYYQNDRTLLMASMVPRIPQKLIEVIDYVVVFFELSPIFFVLAGRIWWKIWILLAILFHIFSILFLNIPFIAHAVVYLPFLLPSLELKKGSLKQYLSYFIVVICFVQTVLLVFIELTFTDLLFGSVLQDLYLSLALWVVLFIVGTRTILITKRLKTRVMPKNE